MGLLSCTYEKMRIPFWGLNVCNSNIIFAYLNRESLEGYKVRIPDCKIAVSLILDN